jgi:hypothetical protein
MQTQLEIIVQKMIDAKESEDDIASVIQEYKKTNPEGMNQTLQNVETKPTRPLPVPPSEVGPLGLPNEPGTFAGGVLKSLTQGEAPIAGLKGGLGYLQGAVLDIPSSIYGALETGANLITDPVKTGTNLWEGIKQLPSHFAELTSKSGYDPVAFGRAMGQLTGQPAVTAGIAKIPPTSVVRALGYPTEISGKILQNQGISGFFPPIAVPKHLKRAEQLFGGGLEKIGQRMKQVGLTPEEINAPALNQWYGGEKPSPVPPPEQTILPSSPDVWDDLLKESRPISDADALRNFYGGEKPGSVPPSEPTVMPNNPDVWDELRARLLPVSDADALRNFYGGDKPSPIPPPAQTIMPNTPDIWDELLRESNPPPEPQPQFSSLEPSPARPGAVGPLLPETTSVDDLTNILKRLLTDPTGEFTPMEMWQNLKKLLGRDPTPGEVESGMARQVKPGETTGRVAQFGQTTPSGESVPSNILQEFQRFKRENPEDQFGPQPEIPPQDKWDIGEWPPSRKIDQPLSPEEWNRYQELSAAFQNHNFRDLPLETQQGMRAEFQALHQKFPHVQNMGKIGDLQNVIDSASEVPTEPWKSPEESAADWSQEKLPEEGTQTDINSYLQSLDANELRPYLDELSSAMGQATGPDFYTISNTYTNALRHYKELTGKDYLGPEDVYRHPGLREAIPGIDQPSPLPEQGQMFPMKMREQSQLENIANADPLGHGLDLSSLTPEDLSYLDSLEEPMGLPEKYRMPPEPVQLELPTRKGKKPPK